MPDDWDLTETEYRGLLLARARNPGLPLPCPFCGKAPEVRELPTGVIVICTNVRGCPVNCHSTEARDLTDAVARWNTRN